MKLLKHLREALAGVFALALAVSLLPTQALAASVAFAGGSLTVNNVKKGDTVRLYKVVEDKYDSTTNTMSSALSSKITGITWDEYKKNATDSTGALNNANTIAGLLYDKAADYTATATGESVTFDGTLDSGQYLVLITPADNTPRSFQNTIVTVRPNAKADGTGFEWPTDKPTVNLKATDLTDPGTFDKKVEGAGFTSANVGDVKNFTLTATIPTFAPNAKNRVFKVTDKPTNITIDTTKDFVVKIGQTTLQKVAAATDESATGYALTANSDGGFTLQLTNNTILANGGQKLTVTYKGTLTAALTSTTSASNEASREFSTDSFSDKTDTTGPVDPEKPETPENPGTHVYSFRVEFTKKGADKGNPALKGAEFKLQRKTTTGTYEDVMRNNVVLTSTAGATAGNYYFDGLAAGEYRLVETKVPSGYSAISPLDFTIADQHNEDWTTETVYLDNNAGDQLNNTVIDPTSTFLDLLPETGEMGTVGLTIAGIGLVAFAVSRLARGRKQQ